MDLTRWIVSELKGPQNQALVVAAASDGRGVVRAYLDLDDPNQQWNMLGTLNSSGIVGVFYHPATGLYLSGPSDNSKAQLSSNMDDSSTWTAGPVGTDYAIRPYRNMNQNLNIYEGETSPGTSVLVFEWRGGQQNEVWDVYAYSSAARAAAAVTA